MKPLFYLSLMFLLFFSVACAPLCWARDDSWDLMTRTETGVDRFRAAYPDFDGSGVVIAVLDTGVDMGVAGLRELPDGSPKVVDVRDFSGEGDLFWEEGRLVPDGEGEELVDSQGRRLKGFRQAAESVIDNRYFMAFLEEKAFSDTSVKDLNGDGDEKDSFGILVFAVKDEKELRYEAVVDVNGDGDLKDGVRLSDYWRNQEAFSLSGKKGDRRQLTMAVNFYPDEKRLSVHFDDGGHGTHVAGIAAGYRVHGQEGYHGMAPGARVISLKIGNNRFAGGCTTTESVKKAYEYGAKYAKDHNVPVVFNMSFGIGSELEGRSAADLFLDDLLWKNPGVVVVTSAGNEGPGLSSVGTPAASVRAMAVGALLSPEAAAAQYGFRLGKETLFSFSSRGGDTNKPDILAPGSACSTVPPWGDRDRMQGTSMASPCAAGCIALLVDGLVRHDPAYEIDNAIIQRAVRNTGRRLDEWTVLDQGGGVLDLPAAYEYAKLLYKTDEPETLREYRIRSSGPGSGRGTAYWRMSPCLPSKDQGISFRVEAGFPEKITDEKKARFYRAFDLVPDVDWISLSKPLVYLKGSKPTSVDVFIDLEGEEPGLYTGRVTAIRRGGGADGSGAERNESASPGSEFEFVVSVMIPHRVTPENRGRIRLAGDLEPGFLDRFYLEVPHSTTAVTGELRIIEGGESSVLIASAFDPEGVDRGLVGVANGTEKRPGSHTLMGKSLVPGTWEIVVNSSVRSRSPADYDLVLTLSGLDLGSPSRLFGGDRARKHLLLPVRCAQAHPFTGTLKGRVGSFVKKEIVEVRDSDCFTLTVTPDSGARRIEWAVDFDRETYALFTDCVLRLEDPETGAAVRNSALGQRSGSISLDLPSARAAAEAPKKYRLLLKPAFTKEADTKLWRFEMTERISWRSGAIQLEPLSLKKGALSLNPGEWTVAEFVLSGPLPAAPEGYRLEGLFEAEARGDIGRILGKRFVLP